MEIYILLGGIGLVTGFLSGLLGIGGGIVLAPLLLYAPPFFGFEPVAMRTVAGLTIVQGFVAGLAGSVSHWRFHFVSARLSIYMGASIFITALIGGAGSRYVSNNVLLFLFACLALIATVLILIPVKHDTENPDVTHLSFNRLRAIAAASGVGFLGGLVGQGGSFILIPLMVSFVHIPTRIAIGTNLAIVLLSSLAGFLGKAATGQIEWLMTIPLLLTVVPAAFLGSIVSRRISTYHLKRTLAVLIGLAAARIWITVIFP
ncbi:sulfite exporter TauE/SafE family protein [Desulfococcaceae bacterium HSG7]|nr:sulfite exporter TauE/SafE family protein [Desulfococcaceae bacterium HSG7]